MGRYDRISVCTTNGFVQPSRIYIKKPDGKWKDLGTNESDVQDTLDVYKTPTYHTPATLRLIYETETEYTGDPYTKGSFQLEPKDAYCFSPSRGDGNLLSCDCWFRATIQKTADVDQIIFHTYNGTQHYLKITWKADGTIETAMSLNGNVVSFRTTNVVKKDNWVSFELYSPRNLRSKVYVQMKFNGVITKTTSFRSFLGFGYNNIIGDTYIQFKDTISVQMYNRPKKSIRTVSFDVSKGGAATTEHTAFSTGNLPVVVRKPKWI